MNELTPERLAEIKERIRQANAGEISSLAMVQGAIHELPMLVEEVERLNETVSAGIEAVQAMNETMNGYVSDLSAAQKRIETMRIALEDIREWAPQDAVMKFDDGDELVIDRCCRALNPTPP